jgi:hypothetical protein
MQFSGGLPVLKAGAVPADGERMLLLAQTLLTVAYLVLVGRVWKLKRRRAAVAARATLPEADRPPEAAVGWPPVDDGFEPYVDEGFAALDAYLSEGFAP